MFEGKISRADKYSSIPELGSEYTPDSVTFGAKKALSHKAKNDLTERVAYEIRAKVPF